MKTSNSRDTLLPLLQETDSGLYCEAGDFFIDPWRPVEKAVVTHAHSDHAAAGSRRYLVAEPNLPLMKLRIGDQGRVDTLPYGETTTIKDIKISFHPSGHILGAAQVRMERGGEIWVVTGDFKRHSDPTAHPFEAIACHTLVMESTFGLPVFRWLSPEIILAQINNWWADNAAAGRTSLLQAYALGKAQRLLAGLSRDIGPVFVHGAVERINAAYRNAGIPLPETRNPVDVSDTSEFQTALVIAPPSAMVPGWMRRFKSFSTAAASGWMRLRGVRRRRALDRGFVISDHADWDGLIETVNACRPEKVLITHGYSDIFARHLCDLGYDAGALSMPYTDSGDLE